MTSIAPVILISRKSIPREGLASIIAGAGLELLQAAARPDDIEWPAGDDPRLVVIDAALDEQPEALVTQVRAYSPGARCLVLTEVFEYASMARCFAEGACGYIVKDMAYPPFVAALRLAAMGEKVLPPIMLVGLLQEAAQAAEVPFELSGDGLLSLREIEVVTCLTAGFSNKVIARELDISEATVKLHVKTILRKLKLANRTQAAMWGTKTGIRSEAVRANLASKVPGQVTHQSRPRGRPRKHAPVYG